MQRYQNSLHFKFFLISVEGGRGAVHRKSIFPQFKKVQIILGEGDVKKLLDFFHNLGYFFLMAPLSKSRLSRSGCWVGGWLAGWEKLGIWRDSASWGWQLLELGNILTNGNYVFPDDWPNG